MPNQSHEFKVFPDPKKPERKLIEVWINGQFIAAIYPDQYTGLHILTKYDVSAFMMPGSPNMVAVGFELEPKTVGQN